jgi:hypothetical protein
MLGIEPPGAEPTALPRCSALGAAMNSHGIDRPKRGRFYLPAWEELERLTATDDPQRQAVYKWERAVVTSRTPLQAGAITQRTVRSEAVAYLNHLWSTYSPQFDPFFPGMPNLRLGSLKRACDFPWHDASRLIAHANAQTHTIYLSCEAFDRESLAHETAHLLAWQDRHGPIFCGALLRIWNGEFGIDRNCAMGFAARLGVAVTEARP